MLPESVVRDSAIKLRNEYLATEGGEGLTWGKVFRLRTWRGVWYSVPASTGSIDGGNVYRVETGFW